MQKSISYFQKRDGDFDGIWRLGIRGLPIRVSGVVGTVLLTCITMGTPWWVPIIVPSIAQYLRSWNCKVLFAILTLLLGGALAAVLYYLRRRSQRAQEIKHCLHKLTHEIRNKQADIYKKLLGETFSDKKLTDELKALLTQICEIVSHYFRLVTEDETINVAIRLAVPADDTRNPISYVYKTYARSSGFSLNRDRTSEPLQISEGTPQFFRGPKYVGGILVFHDLDAAIDDKVYTRTRNHDNFKDDFVTMMAAPLNAWSKDKIELIGLIHVTSRKKDVFRAKHTEPLLFIADLTATTIASTVEHVRLKCP